MLNHDAPRKVIGYAAFLKQFEDATSVDERWWIDSASGLFLDLGSIEDRDFRWTRLKRLDGHLDEMLTLFTKGRR